MQRPPRPAVHRQTDKPNDYYNPTAHAMRINKTHTYIQQKNLAKLFNLIFRSHRELRLCAILPNKIIFLPNRLKSLYVASVFTGVHVMCAHHFVAPGVLQRV